jgi:hypothetical protein
MKRHRHVAFGGKFGFQPLRAKPACGMSIPFSEKPLSPDIRRRPSFRAISAFGGVFTRRSGGGEWL